jgi:hypothetical protein
MKMTVSAKAETVLLSFWGSVSTNQNKSLYQLGKLDFEKQHQKILKEFERE